MFFFRMVIFIIAFWCCFQTMKIVESYIFQFHFWSFISKYNVFECLSFLLNVSVAVRCYEKIYYCFKYVDLVFWIIKVILFILISLWKYRQKYGINYLLLKFKNIFFLVIVIFLDFYLYFIHILYFERLNPSFSNIFF